MNTYDDENFFCSYIELRSGANYNDLIETPAMLDLIGDVRGKSILDIGCGFGMTDEKLAGMGAAHILGIDISSRMIAKAMKKHKRENIEYRVMDADDISVPDRFEKQLSYIVEHPEVSVIGGQIEEFIGSTDNIVGKRVVPEDDHMVKRYLRRRCPFNHVTILLNSHMVKEAGNYQDWHYNEDYFLYCRMLLNGAVFHNLPDTLVYVRVGEEMYKRRGGWKYFKSEAKLQCWMLSHKIIALPRFIINLFIRLCVQVLMPNWLRGFVFQKLFRK